MLKNHNNIKDIQKKPFTLVLRKRCSENTSGGLLLDIYGKKVENGSRERDTRKNLIGSYSIFW